MNFAFMKITIFLHCTWTLFISGMDIQPKPHLDLSSAQANRDLSIFQKKDLFNSRQQEQKEKELKHSYRQLEIYTARIKAKTEQLPITTSYLQGTVEQVKKSLYSLVGGTIPLTEKEKLTSQELAKLTTEKDPQTEENLFQKIKESIQKDQQEINKIVAQEIIALKAQSDQEIVDPSTLQGMRYKILQLNEYAQNEFKANIDIIRDNIFKRTPTTEEIKYSPLADNYFLGVLLLINEFGKTNNEEYLQQAIEFQKRYMFLSSIHSLFNTITNIREKSQLLKILNHYQNKNDTFDIKQLKEDVLKPYLKHHSDDRYRIIPFLFDAIELYGDYAKLDITIALEDLREYHQGFTQAFSAIQKILELKNPWSKEKTIACLIFLDQICTSKAKTPGDSLFFKNQPRLDTQRINSIAQEISTPNDSKIINAYIYLLHTEFILNELLQHRTPQSTRFNEIQEQIDGLKHLLSEEDITVAPMLYAKLIENVTKYIRLKSEKSIVNQDDFDNLPLNYFKDINDEIDFLHNLIGKIGKSKHQEINETLSILSTKLYKRADSFIDYLTKQIGNQNIKSDEARQKINGFFGIEDIEGSPLSIIKMKAIEKIEHFSEPIKELKDAPLAAVEQKQTVPSEEERERKSLEKERRLAAIAKEIQAKKQPPQLIGVEKAIPTLPAPLPIPSLTSVILENPIKKIPEKPIKSLPRPEEIITEEEEEEIKPTLEIPIIDNTIIRKNLAQKLHTKIIYTSFRGRDQNPWLRNILENLLMQALQLDTEPVIIPFSKKVNSFIHHIINLGTCIEEINKNNNDPTKPKIDLEYYSEYILALATHPLLDKEFENSLMNISPEIFKENDVNFYLFQKACATINDIFKGFPIPEEKLVAQEQPAIALDISKKEYAKTALQLDPNDQPRVELKEIKMDFPENDPNAKKDITHPEQLPEQPKTDTTKIPQYPKREPTSFLNTFINGIGTLINGFLNIITYPFTYLFDGISKYF